MWMFVSTFKINCNDYVNCVVLTVLFGCHNGISPLNDCVLYAGICLWNCYHLTRMHVYEGKVQCRIKVGAIDAAASGPCVK